MTQVDLAAVLRLHRERKAKATIVLTPVENPTAYGLVETDADGNVRRFLEKPKPEEITCNTINAGIYVLEPETFDRIPKDTAWSIERSFFPSLVERSETFVAYVYDGYWIDIGTPEKYMQVHRDIMDRRFPRRRSQATPQAAGLVSPDARIEDGAVVEGPCFIDEGTIVKAGARSRRPTRHRPPVPHRGGRASSTRRSSGRTAGSAATPSSASRSSAATATSAATRSLDGGVVLGDKSRRSPIYSTDSDAPSPASERPCREP